MEPKNTGVGSLSLLQQIYPTQELNQGLLHCRQDSLPAELPGTSHQFPGAANKWLESSWAQTTEIHSLIVLEPQNSKSLHWQSCTPSGVSGVGGMGVKLCSLLLPAPGTYWYHLVSPDLHLLNSSLCLHPHLAFFPCFSHVSLPLLFNLPLPYSYKAGIGLSLHLPGATQDDLISRSFSYNYIWKIFFPPHKATFIGSRNQDLEKSFLGSWFNPLHLY